MPARLLIVVLTSLPALPMTAVMPRCRRVPSCQSLPRPRWRPRRKRICRSAQAFGTHVSAS